MAFESSRRDANPARVLIVDDHNLVREALVQSLSLEPGLDVCGQACTGAAALELCASLQPDLMVLDFALPDMTGVEVIDRLEESGARPHVLLLTGAPMDEAERAALSAVADGFVHKETGRDALIEAIWSVLETPLPAPENGCLAPQNADLAPRGGMLNAGALTRRERDVLREIAKGRSVEMMALDLGVSPATVRKHRENIMAKLELKSTAALVRAALQIGTC